MNYEPDVLEDVGHLFTIELQGLPLHELDRLLRRVTQAEETAKHYKQFLHVVMHQRFNARAQHLRQEAGKTTGTVRFEDEGFTVVADLPKRPEYDQAKLKDAVDALRKWGEEPLDYVGIDIKVSETKYNAWPPAVRALFEPARTLKTGKPNYRLEQIDVARLPPVANDPNFNGAQ
jgi:hypothetical protein